MPTTATMIVNPGVSLPALPPGPALGKLFEHVNFPSDNLKLVVIQHVDASFKGIYDDKHDVALLTLTVLEYGSLAAMLLNAGKWVQIDITYDPAQAGLVTEHAFTPIDPRP